MSIRSLAKCKFSVQKISDVVKSLVVEKRLFHYRGAYEKVMGYRFTVSVEIRLVDVEERV